MVVHKGAGVPLELPNGYRCILPGYCAQAEATEVVGYQSQDGEAFAVSVKVVEQEPPTADPRGNVDYGEFIEFGSRDRMGDFMQAFCKEGFRVATLQVGWKKGQDGKLHSANLVADDWSEAMDVSECLPVLVPNALMFIVDRQVQAEVHYHASSREIGFFDNGDGAFIPCTSAQEQYKQNLAGGMSIPDARREALVHTNERLQAYADWCNSKVYGVLNYRFDALGQPIDQGHEVWGIAGSGQAHREMAAHLFEPRVAQKARQLGLQPELRKEPHADNHYFIGTVLQIDERANMAIQSLGRDQWVVHRLGDLGEIPTVGDRLEVVYRNAKVEWAKFEPSKNGQGR